MTRYFEVKKKQGCNNKKVDMCCTVVVMNMKHDIIMINDSLNSKITCKIFDSNCDKK